MSKMTMVYFKVVPKQTFSWRLKLAFVLMCVFTGLFTMQSVSKHMKNSCSYAATVNVVQELCALYRDKQFDGPMCSNMCDQSVFSYDFCGQDAFSDKFVLIMGCDRCGVGKDVDKVVMKVRFDKEKWSNITTYLFKESLSVEDTISRVREFVRNQFIEHLGEVLPNNSDVLSLMIRSDFETWILGRQKRDILPTLRSIVSLSLQSEYIKMSFLSPSSFLPELYGFCGPAFFVENTPSLNQLGYIVPIKAMASEIQTWNMRLQSWPKRAKAALSLLSTLRSLESSNKTTLHICDLEIRNTGINSKKDVVFLDIDKARYEMEFTGRNCSSDGQCLIETCMGHCDVDKGICTKERINNNLQVACKKIFVGGYKGIFGLLRFPPLAIAAELFSVLDQCSEPIKYQGRPKTKQNATNLKILERLQTILTSSLENM